MELSEALGCRIGGHAGIDAPQTVADAMDVAGVVHDSLRLRRGNCLLLTRTMELGSPAATLW
jgi:hypothetical protein